MKIIRFLLLFPLLLVGGCGKNKLDDRHLIIGCSPTPHAEILKAAAPIFKENGYILEIKVLNDYVTPNTLLDSGDIDANYFQHVPYLEEFNAKNGTDLSWIVKVHFEPMGIYSSKHTTLDVTWPKIAIPSDKSNGDRARALLEANGITTWDRIIEVEAQALPSVLKDVDYAVINGNYALSSKITNQCIVTEDKNSDIAQRNANVVAVKTSSLKYEWVNVIRDVMTCDKMRSVINTYFGSSVMAVF